MAAYLNLNVIISVEFAVGNIIRRVLHIIREEYRTNVSTSSSENTNNTAASELMNRIAQEIGRSSSPLDDDLSFAAFKQQSGSFLPSNTSNTSLATSTSTNISSIGRSMTDSSMYNLLAEKSADVDYTRPLFALKQLVIQGLNELIDELETVESNIASQSLEYIHNK